MKVQTFAVAPISIIDWAREICGDILGAEGPFLNREASADGNPPFTHFVCGHTMTREQFDDFANRLKETYPHITIDAEQLENRGGIHEIVENDGIKRLLIRYGLVLNERR